MDTGSREPLRPEDSYPKPRGQADLPEMARVPPGPSGWMRPQASRNPGSSANSRLAWLPASLQLLLLVLTSAASRPLTSETSKGLLALQQRRKVPLLGHYRAGVGLPNSRAQIRVVCSALCFQQRENSDRIRIGGAGKDEQHPSPRLHVKKVRHRVEKGPVQGHTVVIGEDIAESLESIVPAA